MKGTITGIALAGTVALGGVGIDGASLNEVPIDQVEEVAGYQVKVKQTGDIVKAEFPWKDQTGIKVAFDMKPPTLSEQLKDKRDKQVITEKVNFGDGGFKVDILLDKKPDTNVFCYNIEGAENYDFFYQPPLSQTENVNLPWMDYCTDTQCFDKSGDLRANQDENIVGSYAVYHKTLANHKEGQQNYATGKVLHIPRPQVWEVNNKEATKQWADLSYDNGQLCVTASQKFLDQATYPVRIDPTFGYTTLGAGNIDYLARLSGPQSQSFGASSTLAVAGDVTEISIGIQSFFGTTGNVDFAGVIYDYQSGGASTHARVNYAETLNATFTSTAAFVNIPASFSLAADTYIILPVANGDDVTDDFGDKPYLRGDTVSGYKTFYKSVSAAGSYATVRDGDPLSAAGSAFGSKPSLYATYTESSGGGGEPAPEAQELILFN